MKIDLDGLNALKENDKIVYVTTSEGAVKKYDGFVWQHQGHRLRLKVPDASPNEYLWSLERNQPTGSKGYVGGEVWLEWPD